MRTRGDRLPYHLRPHKTVDRRLFIDLLGRFERWQPLSGYAYISMGAYPLEDHKQIHRQFGLTRLISFDLDEEIVKRQVFNRPISSCHCLVRSSDEVVSDIEAVLREGHAEDAEGVIVWLDYTNPSRLGEQVREFQELIDELAVNDIVRVTVNANVTSLSDGELLGGTRKPTAVEVREARLRKLRERIDEYLPSDTVQEMMTHQRYPTLLARSFGAAATKAHPPTNSKMFVPLSIVSYADGQQMLSITGVILEREKQLEFRSSLGLDEWPFTVSGWDNVHHLEVPDLTYRERLLLEQRMSEASPDELREQLGFSLGEGDNFLQNYQRFYRFYPSLIAMDA